METVLVIVAILVIAAIAGAAIWYFQRTKRSEQLRDRFGPEYERAVSEAGRGEGERDLRDREERVARLEIRELGREQRQQYADRWKAVQAEFVDAPEAAIIAADDLVQEVMASRGYPVADFEQRAADLSVQHADLVSSYRKAHAISEAHRKQPRSTEELRQAMIHYRALFADLLGEVAARR